MSKNIYIFDLDNTLYKFNDTSNIDGTNTNIDGTNTSNIDGTNTNIDGTNNTSNKYKISTKVNKNLLNQLNGPKILFSNANIVHCINLLKVLDIYDEFQAIFCSSNLKGYKPNPFIYKKIEQICGLKNYNNIYFFDDMPINLYPAKQLGWNTYLIGALTHQNFFTTVNNTDMYIDKQFGSINDALEYFIQK